MNFYGKISTQRKSTSFTLKIYALEKLQAFESFCNKHRITFRILQGKSKDNINFFID